MGIGKSVSSTLHKSVVMSTTRPQYLFSRSSSSRTFIGSFRKTASSSLTTQKRYSTAAATMFKIEKKLPQTETSKHIQPSEALHCAYQNIGTALPTNLRQEWRLVGQIPSRVETFEQQTDRALKLLRSKETQLEKYTLMAQLRNNNTRLFYKIVNENIEEFAPIIYTPTVGEACQKYSELYPFLAPPGTPDGLYIRLADLPNLDEIIETYKHRVGDHADITVITDGSRILGLGDLGLNGMPISMGKLQLYVAGAGIKPRKTLPIVLDFGTDNEDNLKNEFYLGVREKRPDDNTFYNAIDQVLAALIRHYPDIVIQFEDFSSDHAFGILAKYKNNIRCFNDDIQGTGAVILSGMINAFRRVEKESKVSIRDHRIVFHGAGSAAVGVAKQIQDYMEKEHGLSEEEAKKIFYLCDSKGLVTSDRGDKLPKHKVYYARHDNEGKQFKSLEDVVDYIKPTALIGLSTVHNAFNEGVLKRMKDINNQPIIFPLSNPATKSECTYEDALKYAGNKVIFASGTAFPAIEDSETKELHKPGQGNNMYIFPGLGMGAILARPKHITDDIVLRASKALADSLTSEEHEQGLLYPELSRIREVSASVAAAVVDQAVKDKLATANEVLSVKPNEYVDYVQSRMWTPTYEDCKL